MHVIKKLATCTLRQTQNARTYRPTLPPPEVRHELQFVVLAAPCRLSFSCSIYSDTDLLAAALLLRQAADCGSLDE